MMLPSLAMLPSRRANFPRRRAFTLLEMILSLAIGLVLLGGLYFMLAGQFRITQSGRDILDDGTIARSILTRLGSDIQGNLGPVDLRVVADTAIAPDETMAEEETTPDEDTESSTPPEEGMTTPMSGAKPSTSGSTPSSMGSATGADNTLRVNIGVQGTDSQLILIVGKANRPGETSSGLRRILYWMTEGGLARKEISNVTGIGEYNLRPQDITEPEKAVIAPEVTKVYFEYFDGTSWKTSWDGTVKSGDLGNPQGPPSAIRITLTMRKRGGGVNEAGEPQTIEFQHVVALPAGNHFPQGDM